MLHHARGWGHPADKGKSTDREYPTELVGMAVNGIRVQRDEEI